MSLFATTFSSTSQSVRSLALINHHHHHLYSSAALPFRFFAAKKPSLQLPITQTPSKDSGQWLSVSANSSVKSDFISDISIGGGNGGIFGGNNGGGRGGGGGGDESDKNKKEALIALAEAGKGLDDLGEDVKAAIVEGRLPGSIVTRLLELEKSSFPPWLMKVVGLKDRLLADPLFLAKVLIECGVVGVVTKIATEHERRKVNVFNELETVFADVVTAIIADFMLVYLPAPTVSLRPPIAVNTGRIPKYFHNCPDNAFQGALRCMSSSWSQSIGAIGVPGFLFCPDTLSIRPLNLPEHMMTIRGDVPCNSGSQGCTQVAGMYPDWVSFDGKDGKQLGPVQAADLCAAWHVGLCLQLAKSTTPPVTSYTASLMASLSKTEVK